MSLQKHCASYATTMVTTLLYKGMGLTAIASVAELEELQSAVKPRW